MSTAALDPARFAQVKAIFQRLCELAPAKREAALILATDDLQVRAEVLRLLAHASSTFDTQPLRGALERWGGSAAPGEVLGAWTLLEVIGAGGMGQVFRARRSDGHFEQQAAVKVLAGIPSAAALRHLARERQILATLAHPNIARLLDGGSTANGQPYLVMEFVEGQPILMHCQQAALSTRQRLHLLLDVCTAVSFAHQQLVVHCDLKPGNVLVTPSGRPMLLDFGISRLLDQADRAEPQPGPNDAASQTAAPGGDARSTHTFYTPRYASPEQKAGQRLGTATDVYSLGLLLVELLEAPWPEGGSPQLAALPFELSAIIRRATATDPAQRYASVDLLRADLQRYLDGLPVHACRASLGYRSRKWLQRHALPTAVVLLFVATLAFSSWRMREERDSARTSATAAQAVTDYMVSVFQGADPELAGQRDLPLSQVLDAGRERLQSALAEQPAIRAQLAVILGGVYQSIGQRTQALALFDEAIELGRAAPRSLDASSRLAAALYRKAYTLYDQEDLAVAAPVAREALTLHAQVAAGSAEHLASQRLLGSILCYAEQPEEALRWLDDALSQAQTRYGAEDLQSALAHQDLARCHGALGDAVPAVLRHAAAAEQLFTRLLGAQHFRVGDALQFRILGLVQSGAASEAVPLAERLVQQRTELYGAISHPRSYALHVQGSVLRRAGRWLDAIAAFEASLAIHAELDGPDAMALVMPLQGLAATLEDAGHDAAALAASERLARIRQSSAAPPTPQLDLQMRIARLLLRLDRVADAAAVLDAVDAAATMSAANPAWHSEWLVLRAALARGQGRWSESSSWLAQVPSDTDPLLQQAAQLEAARLLHAQAQLSAALEALRKALGETPVHSPASQDAQTQTRWLQHLEYAQWLLQAGREDEARQWAQTIAAHTNGAIHPQGRWARTLQQLGVSY